MKKIHIKTKGLLAFHTHGCANCFAILETEDRNCWYCGADVKDSYSKEECADTIKDLLPKKAE